MVYCRNTEDLAEATAKIKLITNETSLKTIELEFGRGKHEFSHEGLEEFTSTMENSSIKNLQLGIYIDPRAPIEKYHPLIKRIIQCQSIHSLILLDHSPINHFDSFVEAISRNFAIENLRIFFSNSGRKAAASIAKYLCSKNSSLKYLNLSNTRMDIEGFSAVMKALHNYPSVKALNVSNCGIGTEGAKSIGQLLQSSKCAIKKLELSCNNDIRDEGCAAVMMGLLENSSIRVLQMNWCEIGKEGAEFIANSLCSDKCSIEELYLIGNIGIGDEGCVVIMEALKNNNSIFKLDLSACGIGDVGMKAIAKVLQNNHAVCLRTLSLQWNENIGAEGFKVLAILLSQNSSLEALDLCGCNVGDGGCTVLMNALCQNSSLKVLSLERCEIGNEGGKAVADFLKSNAGPIHDLKLNSNDFDEESLIEISQALCFNTHLKS